MPWPEARAERLEPRAEPPFADPFVGDSGGSFDKLSRGTAGAERAAGEPPDADASDLRFLASAISQNGRLRPRERPLVL